MVLMVKDGNYVHVADAHINSFIKKGYAVADGVVPTPKDELAALKAENAQLKAELEVYKEQVFNMLKPVEGPGSAPDAPVVEEKPKKSRKAKSE